MNRRVGGILLLTIDGQRVQAKGVFTYNINSTKRESVVGHDGVHGFKELPQAVFIDGIITDSNELDLQRFFAIRDATVQLQVANGKLVVLREAFYSADGEATTEEGEVQCRFEGVSGEEIPA